MNTSQSMRIVFLTILYFMLFQVLAIGESIAATYYIAPNGSNGNAGSIDFPWATFAYAQTQISAGDTLILKDGTYHDSLTITKSGKSGNPITFRAQNDGSAIVDGDYTRTPFEIDKKNHITVEGIFFKESDSHVIDIDTADNLIFRRVTARDAVNPEKNEHVWRLSGVTNSLFEDCAGWGNGRNIMLIYKPSHDVTVRRFYGRFHNKQSSHGPVGIQVYGSYNCLLENVLITYDGKGTWGSPTEYYLSGINIWDNNQSSTHSNKIYGSVVWNLKMVKYMADDFGVASKTFQMTNNELKDVVSINNNYGILWANDSSFKATNVTVVNCSRGIVHRDNNANSSIDAIDLKNSIITGSAACGFDYLNAPNGNSITHLYNNWYNNGAHFCDDGQDTTEMNINPSFDTPTYGYGAYLMRPPALFGLGKNGADLGAEVLFRYENGILTDKPLWPWPMEDRIYNEAGVSVTYEAKGGIWKTLENVYDSSSQLPNSPTGLQIIEN